MTPDQYTLSEHMLEVGEGHTLYVQEWGSQETSTTFIFLHGGPGSGCKDSHKALFDPAKHHVVFFDQRGAGKSTPSGELQHNQTEHLIEDINRIAKKLALKEFVLVGGSWGSTLALAYTLAHPDMVKALVIRGIFTGSQQEIDFLERGGQKAFFPDTWQRFLDQTPKEHHDDPAAYHGARVLGKDERAMKASAYAFADLEGSVAALDDRFALPPFEDFDPLSIRIEIHYTQNLCFMPDNYILDNAHKLSLPVHIIQGRYDAVCAPQTAYKLHQLLPNSTLTWTLAGHSGHDRANYDATKLAIELFA